VALRVLAHFVPGGKVLEFLAPESGWLDIRWCAEDDDASFYRELPDAEAHTSTRDDGRPGWRRLPDLLGASDIVSLHLPLTAQTHHLLDRDTLARMKPNAAGLDVFEVEPVAPDHHAALSGRGGGQLPPALRR